jgi:DNA polymerase delta subunit 4
MAKTAAHKESLHKTLKSRKAKAAVHEKAQAGSKSALTFAAESKKAPAAPAVAPPEEQLRAFDLELQYGPCAGLTRLERWERAKQLGLDPPENICTLLKGLPAAHQISVFGRTI